MASPQEALLIHRVTICIRKVRTFIFRPQGAKAACPGQPVQFRRCNDELVNSQPVCRRVIQRSGKAAQRQARARDCPRQFNRHAPNACLLSSTDRHANQNALAIARKNQRQFTFKTIGRNLRQPGGIAQSAKQALLRRKTEAEGLSGEKYQSRLHRTSVRRGLPATYLGVPFRRRNVVRTRRIKCEIHTQQRVTYRPWKLPLRPFRRSQR